MYSSLPTLAERKSATIGAKQLFCLQTSVRIFPQFHAFLTHLPLVSSFRLSFTSSASNAFFCQFAVLRTGKLSSFYVKKRDLSVSAHRILFTCLATSYSCGT